MEKHVSEKIVEEIKTIREKILESVDRIDADRILKKNLYLGCAFNSNIESFIEDSVNGIVQASIETHFGNFFEKIVIEVLDTRIISIKKDKKQSKTGTRGVDIDCEIDGERCLISVKSSSNTLNSSSGSAQVKDFNTAVNIISGHGKLPCLKKIMGICCGPPSTSYRSKTSDVQLVGRHFWTFITKEENFYLELCGHLRTGSEEFGEELINRRKKLIEKVIDEFYILFHGVRKEDLWETAIIYSYSIKKRNNKSKSSSRKKPRKKTGYLF